MPESTIENKEDIDWKIPALIIGIVLVLWGATWWFMINQPHRGTYGDMFGIVNALFSGLAFSGIIIALLLQRKDLKLQREQLAKNSKEFEKTAKAQALNAKLTALTTLLREYKDQIASNDQTIKAIAESGATSTSLQEENLNLIGRKTAILTQIDQILAKLDIELTST